jgi:predicted AlkP superfamily phosphohydrolase/phosphomutase
MKSVKQREEVYPGTDAPDILCVMEDESINLHEGFLAPDVWVSREDVAWGRHASRGVMAIQGAAATVNPRGDAADICPTILSLLGLKTDGLDGKSIVQADASQLVTVSADSVSGGGFQKEDAYSEDQEAAVLEHLRGLGYIE